MSAVDNESLVRHLYTEVSAGTPGPLIDHLADDVAWTIIGSTPLSGVYRGRHDVFSRLFAGLRRPKRTILGSEFAGVVAAVGSAVTEFSVGDEVFGVNADSSAPTPSTCASVSAPRSSRSRPASRSRRQRRCATARSSP